MIAIADRNRLVCVHCFSEEMLNEIIDMQLRWDEKRIIRSIHGRRLDDGRWKIEVRWDEYEYDRRPGVLGIRDIYDKLSQTQLKLLEFMERER